MWIEIEKRELKRAHIKWGKKKHGGNCRFICEIQL